MITVSKAQRIRARLAGQPLIGRAPKCLSAANDTHLIIKASFAELQAKERVLLSDLACGDTDERAVFAELALVRRSMTAAGTSRNLRAVS